MRLAAALALLLAADVAVAATIHVPGDQPTIQAAVNVASDGDTVLLADGTYQGPGNRDIVVVGKQIVIRSASDDPDLCVIDAQGALGDYHRAFVMNDLPGPGVELRSLTITGAHVGGPVAQARGGAIRVAYSSQPLFENVRFVSNVASEGGAVYANVASPHFVDCEFVGNLSVESGQGAHGIGGAVFLDLAEASFVRCRFSENEAQSGGGAIFTDWNEPLSLLGCEFDGNRSVEHYGGAVSLDGPASMTDCQFTGNSAVLGGAVFTIEALDLAGSTFSGNEASFKAGAVSVWGTASITDCQFAGNSAESQVGALWASGGLDLLGSTFSGNEALYWGAVRVTGSEPATITDCAFFGNLSRIGSAGALIVETGGPAIVDRCRFFSNRARWKAGAVNVGFDTTGEIRESLFVGNVSAGEAGAVLVRSASFLVEQCTLVGNSATAGGGIVFGPDSNAPNPELLVRNTVIAFGDAGGAISCSHPGVTMTCTDLFGNAGGDVLCGTDGGGNFSADPFFCAAEQGDFNLSSQSPCLPGNHPDGADCGLIGALGEGCGPVSVEQESWAGIKARYRSDHRRAGP